MNKALALFSVLATCVLGYVTFDLYTRDRYTKTAHNPGNVDYAVAEVQARLNRSTLTENDIDMLKQIISMRVQGIMIKIVPQFSQEGAALHMLIISTARDFGGFQTAKGKQFAQQVSALLDDYHAISSGKNSEMSS